LALQLRLPDAEDRNQARSPRADDLLTHHRIAFTVAVAALGMAENDMATTHGQHLWADIAGIGTFWRGMAILTAEGDAAACEHTSNRRQQGCRRANEKRAARPAARGRAPVPHRLRATHSSSNCRR
jgi:hypothetical protein